MPQDAARLNRMQIREQEQLNRQRRAQDEVEARRQAEALKRSKNQYSHVRSHGYGHGAGAAPARGSGPTTAAEDDAQIRVYVRECDADRARSYTYWESEGVDETAVDAGPSRPSAQPQTRLPQLQRAPRQMSSSSSSGLATGGARSVPAAHSSPTAAPNQGRVPKYLVQRKAEMAAEREAIEAEAERRRELAKIPPGHRLVSEAEKEETLAGLDARRTELETQLAKIPIRFDTLAIRTRRANIEEELRQIETTKLKYNTKKPLYVPLN